MLNLSLGKFKTQYKRKKNQIIYYSVYTNGENEIENLINNFLIEKDSFIFESVEKGFIKVETISYKDFVDNEGWVNSKNNGKMRLEGKEYVVKDGDVLNFRFNT